MAPPSTEKPEEGQIPKAEDGAEKTGNISTSGLEAPSVLIVDWEGPNDPANPKK
ncbi:hypothetical protein TRAPUB_4657 [Trametes pubescens]|uniref:Uncharacterized protein n=1 Tax=Trametes pubescens TaxID=154538 RepID=A0A1M2VAS0_TRAPU|nr:hypothetical protein TRAPUB_4657 [Trametes pubescens]